jgi:hypothetical protein
MTQYSIHSEISQESFSNYQDDNYPSEVDSQDWELRMAQLVGLETESLSNESDSEVLTEAVNLEAAESELEQEKTEQSLSSNPFAKLGLVGGATFLVVLFAGVFLTQIMSGSNQKPSSDNVVLEDKTPVKPQSKQEELEKQVDTLKTKLALTEQAEAIKLAQQQLRNGRLTSSSELAAAQNSQPNTSRARETVVQRTPTPVSTVYVPRIVTVERVVRVPAPQPPVVTPAVPPQPVIPNSQTQPVLVQTPPTPNSLQEWERLAKLGSYGQVSGSDQSNMNVTAQPERNNDRTQQQATNPQPQPTPQPQTSRVGTGMQQSPKSIAVGSNAKAVLATAVFGETTKSQTSDRTNVFVVRLQEPLKAVDGAIAIPANTELLTQMSSVSDQGLVQLDVIKVIVPDQGKLRERTIPQNALMIRAPQGKPLIANQYPNRGSSIASMDIGLFVLGGLGKAAELINRTESQVVTTSGSSTIVSNTNPERNILAGVFEGGMNTVVPQIAQRNQQAISQMSQRTNLWFLPAGTAVEIYANQALQF